MTAHRNDAKGAKMNKSDKNISDSLAPGAILFFFALRII